MISNLAGRRDEIE